MQIQFSEKELEDFLCSKDNLYQYLELKFIARQIPIPPAGIIDILAYSMICKCWVIIELKKENLDLNSLAQGMSYLRYFKETRGLIRNHKTKFSRKRKFALLLVGRNLDESLTKIVERAQNNFHDNSILYNLFGISLESGISLTFYNTIEEKYNEKLVNLYETRDFERFNINQ